MRGARGGRTIRPILSAMLTMALCAAGAAAPAHAADMLGIATSSPGSVYHSAGTAIATVANHEAGLQMTVQAFASPNVYLAGVNTGQVAFGVSNSGDAQLASAGEQHFAGRQMPKLRAVAVLFPLRQAIYVRKDSPIRSIADLRGRRLPTGFAGQKTIVPLFDAVLATDGLTVADLDEVRVPNIVGGANAFMEGSADAFFFALGAAKVREADASVGGIRALPLTNTPESLAALQAIWPAGYLSEARPGPANTGVLEPVFMMTHDAIIMTGADTPDAAVYALVRALHENPDALAGAFAPFRNFAPDRMISDIPGVQWHPGALAYYREIGQDSALAPEGGDAAR